MKMKFKSLIAISVAIAIISAGCSGSKESKTDTADNGTQVAGAVPDIRGQWHIENIVFNDSDYVRPDEAVPGSNQYITFEDSTYSVITNCNVISGSYTLDGDSITLNDGAMTQMFCDNMATEDAMRRILPNIKTVDVQNDTVIRLNGSTPAECIMLRKATVEIK